MLVCVQGSRTEPAGIAALDRCSGRMDAVVHGWRGLPLNSPNNVVMASDGAV
jgi:hypothetical protein